MTTAAAVRERPILFSAEMVRAILDGRKTQTRRVLRCQPIYKTPRRFVMPEDCPKAWQDCDNVIPLCPYGVIGDRLWVREAFSIDRNYNPEYFLETGEKADFWYWADGNPEDGDWTKPKPSIHMPRALSRLTLEITNVRVERLQAITPDDAAAEGIHDLATFSYDARVTKFGMLWDSLNAKRAYGWAVNPWVWVIEFRRVTQ